MKKFLLLLLPIGLVVFAFLFAQFHPYLDKDFALEDLQGNLLHLGKFAGHPIILVFFSPRCGECKDEMPYLKELYTTHQKEGLVMIGVGVHNQKDIEDFVQEYGVPFPVVVDETLEVSKSFGVFFLPHLVFFDKQGKITYSKAGKIPQEEIKTNLETIL